MHGTLVVRNDGARQLPFDLTHDRMIESRVRSLAEIADLAPGKTGKMTPMLKPGTCLLLCDQPKHYHDGMVAKLIVAR